MNPVLVILHCESEGWWADAPSVPGWSAAAATLPELRVLIEDGIRFALGTDDVSVEETLDTPLPHGGVLFDFIKGQPTTVALRSSAAIVA